MVLKKLFRNKDEKATLFFSEEPVDANFSALADIVRDLETKADFNKTVTAMELIFNAFQKLRGVKINEDIEESTKFLLHEKEGE